jgi:hypothetical protein
MYEQLIPIMTAAVRYIVEGKEYRYPAGTFYPWYKSSSIQGPVVDRAIRLKM